MRGRHLRSDVHVAGDVTTPTLAGHVRAVPAAGAAPVVAGDGRTVEVQICRWDHPEQVTDDGRNWYTESFARGGLTVAPGARVVVRNEHDPSELAELGLTAARPGVDPSRTGVVVGTVTETHVRSDGLYGTIRLVDNDDGHYIRSLIPDVLDRLSIEYDDVWRPIRPGQHVVRTDARLTGLVFTLNPQRGDARVLAIRSDTATEPTTEETPTVDENETPPGTEPAPETTPAAPAPEATPPPAAATTTVTRSVPRPGPADGIAHEDAGAVRLLHQFRSFGHYVQAVAGMRDVDEIRRHQRSLNAGIESAHRIQRYRRAFDVAVNADITGLLPPTWISEIIDLQRSMAPTINAWSTRPLPDKGMSVTQPIVAERPEVGLQSTELDEPASTKVEIDPAQWTVKTYAGGQGMSIQTILRSDPEYLAEIMRLYVPETERAVNAGAAAALLAAADDVHTDPLEYTTPQAFADLMVDASALFLAALGRPAEVVALSIPLWVELGKAKIIQTSVAVSEDAEVDDVTTTTETSAYMFPDINPLGTVGTFDATSPTGQTRKVAWYVEPAFGVEDKKAVVGVREAFRSMVGPLGTMNADDPDTLSRQLAVFKFAAFGATDATGLALIEEDSA